MTNRGVPCPGARIIFMEDTNFEIDELFVILEVREKKFLNRKDYDE